MRRSPFPFFLQNPISESEHYCTRTALSGQSRDNRGAPDPRGPQQLEQPGDAQRVDLAWDWAVQEVGQKPLDVSQVIADAIDVKEVEVAVVRDVRLHDRLALRPCRRLGIKAPHDARCRRAPLMRVASAQIAD